jgi:formylglycine-generating enzyme required for sulfatase activity
VRGSSLLVLAAATGCQLVGGYADFDYGTTSSPEPLEHPCDVLPESKTDAGGLAVMMRVNLHDDSCFWMDRTEVTVEQYARWEDAVPAEGPGGPEWEQAWCRWKTTRSEPGHDTADACRATLLPLDLEPFASRKPMRCVDFCDAEAFCRWADKRLCYDAGVLGVQGPRTGPQEWRLACTNARSTTYPWGDEPASVCNTGQGPDAECIGVTPTCGPFPVGEKAGCKTRSGIVDLLGNVAEWVYSCNYVDPSNPSAPTGCLTLGGGYDEPLQDCNVEKTTMSNDRSPALGFRCCADLTGSEEGTVLEATRR